MYVSIRIKEHLDPSWQEYLEGLEIVQDADGTTRLACISSSEFDPFFHMVSEYALGRDAWVLSLMFLTWGISAWTLVLALWLQVNTVAGKIGWWFLIIAGLGEVMASVFDITHNVAHSKERNR